MRVRRCQALLIEPCEDWSLDLGELLSGGRGWAAQRRWRALAGHLDQPVELDEAMLTALGHLPTEQWCTLDSMADSVPIEVLARLLEARLLLREDDADSDCGRDQALRDSGWHPRSAVLHRHGLWKDSDAQQAAEGLRELGAERRDALMGPPPPAVRRRSEAAPMLLPRAEQDTLDRLLAQRVTCRNFDRERQLPIAALSRVLQRACSAQAIGQAGTAHPLLKKFVPSAGGLHPTEVYLFARRVDGLPAGSYHYLADSHALEPIPMPADVDIDALLRLGLAGQDWFTGAPVVLVLASRFERNFWKYRQHSKSYRAVLLDLGHVSQMLYLGATQAGLGCFVTSAINELPLEQALGLDGIREGVLALSGLGFRSAVRREVEFDPQQQVWPAESE